eukprot:CAMPEP_0174896716 /NCGR_PEP_ID=MMETSP0167-20121228/10841_1 /TAXON_ID=38298 /ORGANISM="Rhodella maculata, Strain CCMP736" /LENGTH=62 /DNA_ID=CAMNT_0016136353 /DNA_START=579 /DNA_END=765 /DNA_ORIENTATION=+
MNEEQQRAYMKTNLSSPSTAAEGGRNRLPVGALKALFRVCILVDVLGVSGKGSSAAGKWGGN